MDNATEYKRFLQKRIPHYFKGLGTSDEMINMLGEHIRNHEVKKILEIGTNHGYSFGFFAFVCDPDVSIVTLDITEYEEFQLVRGEFQRVDLTKLLCSSDAIPYMEYGPFDLVFIDGDHSFEWCKRDWNNIRMSVAPGGAVFFDDMRFHGVRSAFEDIPETEYVSKDPRGILYM